MKICRLKIEESILNKNIIIENVDFENDIVFLDYYNDILFGCRCFIKENTGLKHYIFYSSQSNRTEDVNSVIKISPTGGLNEYRIEIIEH